MGIGAYRKVRCVYCKYELATESAKPRCTHCGSRRFIEISEFTVLKPYRAIDGETMATKKKEESSAPKNPVPPQFEKQSPKKSKSWSEELDEL